MTEGWDRRRFLTALSLTAVGSLAGCQNSTDTSPTNTDQDTPTESSTEPSPDPGTNTSTQTSETAPVQLEIQVGTTGESNPGTVSLPPIWNENDSIDDYQIAVTASSTGAKNSLKQLQLLNDGSVIQETQIGAGDQVTVTVDPADLEVGKNNLYFLGETQSGGTARSEPAVVTKKIPTAYKVDFKHSKNKEIRDKATDAFGEDYLQEQVGKQEITDDPILNNYNTPEGVEYSEKEIDLAALEYWHDNDFPEYNREEIRENPGKEIIIDDPGAATKPKEAVQFIESIDRPDAYAEAKNNTIYMYPNGDFSKGKRGNFVFDEGGEGFAHSDSVGEALDWLHPYLFSWELRFSDVGPISSEDEQYAAVLQEALDRHTEIESHFWSFDLPEAARSTHGNGMVYDETNDEMRAMETIGGPITQEMSENNPQYHPLIENSNYLDPEHDAFNSWWHPLRFAEEYRSDEKQVGEGFGGIDFRTGKENAALAFRGIASGGDDIEYFDNMVDPGVAVTNEYLADFADKLRSWNEDEDLGPEEFENIENMSKFYNKAWNEDENYVTCGTVENPSVTAVSESVIGKVWSDETGAWDDIDARLQGDGPNASASPARQAAM